MSNQINGIHRLIPTHPPIAILGVPFDNVTTSEAVAAIERMVESRQPHYVVTANVDFLVQGQRDAGLRRIFTEADMVLCDGTPLLWASRFLGNRLPERVAGADLVPVLLRVAAEKGYRVFFLGAKPEVAELAVAKLREEHPSLVIAGHYSPPFKPLDEIDNDEIKRRIREARPDLLFVAFGCPKAEKWIAAHYRDLGVPVVAGIGATIDFLAGRVHRAPHWMQRAGMEWIFRLGQEPRRLWRRYVTDLWVFGWRILAQWLLLPRTATGGLGSPVKCGGGGFILDFSAVNLLDSTGIGLLLVLQKKLRADRRRLVLASLSRGARRALERLGLESDFSIVPDLIAAQRAIDSLEVAWPAKLAAA
jgi:exopolysaccharide biosynthesis WecB/TagA/CpsF family protein